MNDCYFDKKDWRACKNEVRFNGFLGERGNRTRSFEGFSCVVCLLTRSWGFFSVQMEAFRECWKRKGNDRRVETKDV